MKKYILLFSELLFASAVFALPKVPKEKNDMVVVVKDSLEGYAFHVSHMTILLDEKPVHWTVVYDTVTNYLKPQYREVHGSIRPYDAIKYYGERYRKGILGFKEESEENNE
ncbi:hypothetical protein [Bacteroides sp.]